jgi:hypothetical protein
MRAMNKIFCAIVTEKINDTQRDLVHAAVRQKADAWWHQMSDIWVVESELSPKEWVELLGIIFPTQPSKLLVLKLSDKSDIRWSSMMPEKAADWFHEHMRNKETSRKLSITPSEEK